MTADAALRIDAVEDLVNADNPLLTTKEKKQTFTIGAELGNMLEGKQRRWTISDSNHVTMVADGIIDLFRKVGLPYLERYSDFGNLIADLSKHDQAAWPHSPVHERRCKTIMALAALLHDEQRFELLNEGCEEFLRGRSDAELASLRVYVKGLRNRHTAD